MREAVSVVERFILAAGFALAPECDTVPVSLFILWKVEVEPIECLAIRDICVGLCNRREVMQGFVKRKRCRVYVGQTGGRVNDRCVGELIVFVIVMGMRKGRQERGQVQYGSLWGTVFGEDRQLMGIVYMRPRGFGCERRRRG